MTNRTCKLGVEHVLFVGVHFNRYGALLGQTQSRFKTFCNSLAQGIAGGRFGFEARHTGSLTLPGPVDRKRFLGLELVAGAFDGVDGPVQALAA